MDTFNLIDSPWIPVRWRTDAAGDTPALVSLDEAFRRGSEIADLDCAPHERIALTRLLVCITHAALGAPEDDESWDGFGDDLETAVSEYLHRDDIHPHFNLLGDGPRFLQEDVSPTKTLVPISKMIFQLATGNNPTLLDHAGNDSTRKFKAHEVALGLLTFQNFYPLFGAGFKGRGPCSDGNALHTLLLGSNLKEAILLNLVDRETVDSFAAAGFGKPIWECREKEYLMKSTQSYLGRLVPRHRSIKLKESLDGFFHQNVNLEYPKWEPYREATTTIILNSKEERRLLPARVERAVWRDLHALVAIRFTNEVGAAAVLRSHANDFAVGQPRIWVGALITDLKAKIIDYTESTFTVPKKLVSEDGRQVYAAGIEHAENISKSLYGSIKTYWSALKHENPPMGEGQKHFWHQLDQHHRILIQLAGDPESRRGQPGFGAEGAEDSWTELVRNAAQAAFDSVCPRSTPRQIQAYASGIKPLLRALYPKNKANPSKKKASATAS